MTDSKVKDAFIFFSFPKRLLSKWSNVNVTEQAVIQKTVLTAIKLLEQQSSVEAVRELIAAPLKRNLCPS